MARIDQCEELCCPSLRPIEPPAVDAAWRKVREAIDAADLDPDHRYQITKAVIEYASVKAITALDDVMNGLGDR